MYNTLKFVKKTLDNLRAVGILIVELIVLSAPHVSITTSFQTDYGCIVYGSSVNPKATVNDEKPWGAST